MLLHRNLGYDFNLGVDHHALLRSYRTSGFQATSFGLAVEQINAMVGKKNKINYSKMFLESIIFFVRSPGGRSRSPKTRQS